MTTKQKKLISILEKLSPYRPSAEDLIALLSTEKLDDRILEAIVQFIDSSIKELRITKNQAKLDQIKKKITQMGKNEQKEQSEADQILLDL